MILDWEGSSPVVSTSERSGKHEKSCSVQGSHFSLTPGTPWFDLWFVHRVMFGGRRGLYLFSALTLKSGERRPRSQQSQDTRVVPSTFNSFLPKRRSSWQRRATTTSKLSPSEHSRLCSKTDALDEENSPSGV